MAAKNMVSAGGVFGGKLSFKKMSAGGRLSTSQENPHFWVPTIKVRPPTVLGDCCSLMLTAIRVNLEENF